MGLVGGIGTLVEALRHALVGAGARLLDSTMVRRLERTPTGWRVIAGATNAEVAHEADVVTMDLRLGDGTDGVAATRAIHQLWMISVGTVNDARSGRKSVWPNASAQASVGKYKDGTTDMAPYLPSTPENAEKGLVNDAAFWADHGTELTERFNAWLAS